MSDTLTDGRRFRVLNIMDDYNREILANDADTSLPASRLIRLLDRLKEYRGVPEVLRSDNGPEFISDRLRQWADDHAVELRFIQPGKPMQNGFVERLNGSCRRELLDAYLFETLDQVRHMAAEWMFDYNHHRPHQSLNFRAPIELGNTGSSHLT